MISDHALQMCRMRMDGFLFQELTTTGTWWRQPDNDRDIFLRNL